MKRVSLSSLVAILVSLWDREVWVALKTGMTWFSDVIQNPPITLKKLVQIIKGTPNFQISLISRKY